jgi:hypothetical protein
VDEIKFALKMFFATLAIIAIMQIRVGGRTMESKTYQILAQSKFADFLNDVARGTVQLGKQTKDYVEGQIKKINSPSGN